MTVFELDPELLRLLRPPRLRSLEDGPRHASYLELFFDAGLIAVAALGGGLDPVVFTALTTAVLVALVVFKLWSAHREAAAIAPLVEA